MKKRIVKIIISKFTSTEIQAVIGYVLIDVSKDLNAPILRVYCTGLLNPTPSSTWSYLATRALGFAFCKTGNCPSHRGWAVGCGVDQTFLPKPEVKESVQLCVYTPPPTHMAGQANTLL
jgi:hypothetical protein